MQLYVFVLIAGVGGETENIWKGKELRCSQNSFFPVDGEWVGLRTEVPDYYRHVCNTFCWLTQLHNICHAVITFSG